MPNWCSTEIAIEAEPETLDIITFCLDMCKKHRYVENSFTGIFEGNVLKYFGIPARNDIKIPYSYRGEISYYTRDSDNVLFIDQFDAWAPNIEFWHDVFRKMDRNGEIYYMATEPGVGLYVTNDRAGRFFPFTWKFECQTCEDIPELNLDKNSDYELSGISEADLLSQVNALMKSDFKSLGDARSAIEKHESCFSWYSIYQYEYE